MKKMFTKIIAISFVISAVTSIGAAIIASPTAQAAGRVYAKYSWSNCVYDVSSTPRYVSKSEYDAAGRPAVWVVNRMQGDELVRFKTHHEEIFLAQPRSAPYYACPAKHLTRADWNALGNPTPRNLDNEFIKIPNNNVIYMGAYGDYSALSKTQWVFYGMPTPELRSGF